MQFDDLELFFDKTFESKSLLLSSFSSDYSIKTLYFSRRTENALLAYGTRSIADLLGLNLFQLQKIPNLGKKSIIEIYDIVTCIDADFVNKVESLGLSSESLEFLLANDVKSINDFANFDVNGISIPYLGKKIINELSAVLQKKSLILPEKYPENPLLAESISIMKLENEDLNMLNANDIYSIDDFLRFQFFDTNTIPKENAIFFEFLQKGWKDRFHHKRDLNQILDSISAKGSSQLSNKQLIRMNALKQRLTGLITLQNAGDQIGISRERVRQLEAKALRKLDVFLPRILLELRLIKFTVNEPMYSWKLPMQNDFFHGSAEIFSPTSLILKRLDKSPYCSVQFENFENNIILSKKGKIDFQTILDEIKKNDYEQEEALSLITAVARTDIKQLVINYLDKNKPTSVRGKSINAVKEIFKSASTLLSVSDIKEILKDKYNIPVESNQVAEAIKHNDGVYLFGKNVWGHEDIFRKLSDNQLEAISVDLIQILILSSGKQRGRIGLLKELRKKHENSKFTSIVNSLEPHDIDWILKKVNFRYPKLKNLNRGNWIWGSGSHERITIGHAILRVLEQEGIPLRTEILKEKVERIRGVTNENFQPRTNRNRPELIQLEPEYHGKGNFVMWGLRDRDLSISRDLQDKLFKAICSEFHNEKKFINLEQLEDLIHQVGIDKHISTLQVLRMLAAYTANRDMDNEFFSINFGRLKKLSSESFKLENRIKFKYSDFDK